MEVGQCLGVLNAFVAIGLTVLSPLAYPRKANRPAHEITVSNGNCDPINHPTEIASEPENSSAAKSTKDVRPMEEALLEPSAESPLQKLLPFADAKKPTLLEKAYLDAFSVLNENNSCSRFYGGASAIDALNDLVRKLTTTHLDRSIAIRMMGETTRVQDYGTGRVYRRFQKAEINLSGPFYKGNTSPSELKSPPIGYYQPNTREARVTILLHELGHLLRGDDKQWLLPDDGNDQELSHSNTLRVISVCRNEIDRISHLGFERELIGARTTH